LPSLRRIALHNIDLSHAPPHKPKEKELVVPKEKAKEVQDDLPSLADCLRAFLWARRQGNARVTEMELDNCQSIFKLDIDHFRFFADVTWDGKGANETDREDGGDRFERYSIEVFSRLPEYSIPDYNVLGPL